MSIYLNKINDFNKLNKIVKSIDGYNNPSTAIKITKNLINEMMKNIKDKYKLDPYYKTLPDNVRLIIDTVKKT